MDCSRQTLREITSAHHQTLNTNQDGCDEARAPEAHKFASLDRHDSGFGDVWRPRSKISYNPQPADKAMAPSGSAVPTIRCDMKLSENVAPQRIAQCTTTHKLSEQRSSQELGVDVLVTSRRPRSLTRRSSRRSTPVTSCRPSSNNSARKSSVASYDKRLNTAAHRCINAEYRRARTEDVLALYRESVQLFQTFSNTPNRPAALSLASRRHTSPTITLVSPSSYPQRNASQDSVDQAGLETLREGPYQYENFVPAPSIDWTHASTRARQYRKIDQSCRGLRGLWRRLTPRWCHGKSGHLDFFREDDDKSDTGSVRRYRIDIAGTGEGSKWGLGEEEKEIENKHESRPSKAHRLRRFLSFSREKRTLTPVRDFEASIGKWGGAGG